MEGGLLNGHVEELDWINYLKRKMRVVDDEKELYFVFSLSLFEPCILGPRIRLCVNSAAFLAEAFLRSIPKIRTCGLA